MLGKKRKKETERSKMRREKKKSNHAAIDGTRAVVGEKSGHNARAKKRREKRKSYAMICCGKKKRKRTSHPVLARKTRGKLGKQKKKGRGILPLSLQGREKRKKGGRSRSLDSPRRRKETGGAMLQKEGGGMVLKPCVWPQKRGKKRKEREHIAQ